MVKLTQKQIRDKLSEVLDPEINISIVDLGLIYDIKISKSYAVTIVMTLTTVACPLSDMIKFEIINKIKELGLKEKNIKIMLTFDPPWSMDMMTKRGKTMLGI